MASAYRVLYKGQKYQSIWLPSIAICRIFFLLLIALFSYWWISPIVIYAREKIEIIPLAPKKAITTFSCFKKKTIIFSNVINADELLKGHVCWAIFSSQAIYLSGKGKPILHQVKHFLWVQGSQQNTHNPKGKLPKIITHKGK